MASRSSRRLPVAGLGALVLLNVVLVALLVTRPTTPVVDVADRPATVTPGVEATTPPTKQETDGLAEVERLARSGRLLVNVDGTTAWRATAGSCGEAGTVERSVDGGLTWQELPVDLAPVSRLRALGPESLSVIGGGAGCAPTYLSSSTAGASWTANDQYLDGSWYLVPGDTDLMGAPAGTVETPCEAVQLAALDTAHAAVLCADVSLALTADGGATWTRHTPDVRARAVGLTDEGYVVAGAWEACADTLAVALIRPDGSAGEEPTCSGVVAPSGEDLAVSAAGGRVWVWTGDEVTVTP
ncbi:hypothetical protein FHE66_02330 [Georgenia sp. 311]|uniref:hypothetical protein n=1 Tax=Georgenia sp. 311 TaxID=2585134 RepID=UPI0011123BCF|nr:hypothetical protein [Georgenia sp. 311]TNC19707.1 hypothetical protein FHE66_02330 [Georgenia sp. 311]